MEEEWMLDERSEAGKWIHSRVIHILGNDLGVDLMVQINQMVGENKSLLLEQQMQLVDLKPVPEISPSSTVSRPQPVLQRIILPGISHERM